MPTPASLLDAALRAAPRRYRLRPMPADAESARADGAPTAVAFALEAARVSQARGVPLAPGVEQTFLDGLAELIRSAMRGDPAYRAMVLRRHDPEVDAYARSVEAAARDGRSVRASVDALAHPGKLRRRGADPAVEPLAALHA
ncbi:MAG TPA: hypothetical protein VFZ93_08345, partial [Albitalea sp.]